MSSKSKNIFSFICIIATAATCNAIVCYKCDSIDLAACAMALDGTELPYEDCKTTSSQCLMSIVDSVTYRGCSAMTPTSGASYTKCCSQSLCNENVFPPGRLKCHHCSGPDCAEAPSGKPRPCRYHHEMDECYTEVRSAREVYRGCRSDTNHTIGAATIYCNTNGCNDELAVRRLTCAQCDSELTRGCKLNLFEANLDKCNITQYESCEVDVLITEPLSCFLYQNLDHVVRGCSPNHNVSLSSQYITECNNDDNCNRQCVKQQRCVTCNSLENKLCQTDPTQLSATACPSAEVASCYACEYNDFHIERGCGSPAKVPNISRCYECSDIAGCNAKKFTRCYKCSSDDDARCANWTLPGYIEIEDCSHPDTACITASFPNATIQRGCESALLNCNQTAASCEKCTSSFCNKNPHTPQRINCYQCMNGADCENLRLAPLPCPQLNTEPTNEPQVCLEYFDSSTSSMVRGCRSNSSLFYSCLLQDHSSKCRFCYENGCNNSPALQFPKMSCFTCARNDLTCELSQGADRNLRPCQRSISFGTAESCYVTRHFDGSTSRGCTFDRPAYEVNELWDQTTYCYENACNTPATTALIIQQLQDKSTFKIQTYYRSQSCTHTSNNLEILLTLYIIFLLLK